MKGCGNCKHNRTCTDGLLCYTCGDNKHWTKDKERRSCATCRHDEVSKKECKVDCGDCRDDNNLWEAKKLNKYKRYAIHKWCDEYRVYDTGLDFIVKICETDSLDNAVFIAKAFEEKGE